MVTYYTKDLSDLELNEIEKVIKPAFICSPQEFEDELRVLRSKYFNEEPTLRRD